MKKLSGFVLCMVIILLVGCSGVEHHPNPPDDGISQAIYDAIGDEEIFYEQRKEGYSPVNAITYHYYINHQQEGQLIELVNAVNDEILRSDSQEAINLMFWVWIPGGEATVLKISNYDVDEKDNLIFYGTMQRLEIWGKTASAVSTIYNDPATYEKGLPGIKYLEISGKMASITEEKGIDWNEYFPELESLEIISEEK